MIHTSFMRAGSSLRRPFHEKLRKAPVHLIKRRLTFVRRVTFASRWEGWLEGAEQASTGHDLEFGEQDEQMTSPSEQICEMGQVGHLGPWIGAHIFTYGDGIAENISCKPGKTVSRLGAARNAPGELLVRPVGLDARVDTHMALTTSYPISPSTWGR